MTSRRSADGLRIAFLALVVGMVPAGCSSLSGARLYADGTRALESGDASRAVVRLEEASRLLPDSSEVQNHLGIAYQKTGRSEDALAAWRRAVALDCSNQAALANLRAAEDAARGRGEPLLAR